MGEQVTVRARDGREISGYKATANEPKGGIVVVQEIFGVNRHIRNVCDRFAAAGYTAVAPALFDRQVPGFESGYSPEEIDKARGFLADIDWDAMLADTGGAVDLLAAEGLEVAVVGYCLGGSVAYLAAARLDGLSAAICYYGGRIAGFADEPPKCPTMMHFGETDHTIAMSDVEKVSAARPESEVFVYPAGHGFNCDERASYDAESARTAEQRTLDFLRRHVGA